MNNKAPLIMHLIFTAAALMPIIITVFNIYRPFCDKFPVYFGAVSEF